MKRFFTRSCIALILLLVTPRAYATVVGPGGAAITSWNADVDDDFSFVLLENISGFTEIYFTDQGWDSTNNTWNTNSEGEIRWYFSGELYAGTEIHVQNPSSGSPTVDIGEVEKTGSFNVTATKDQIIAYSGTGIPNDGSEVTNFIWAVYSGTGTWGFADNTSQTDLPDGLIDGLTAVDFGTDDNYQYICGQTFNPDSTQITLADEDYFNSGTSDEDYGPSQCVFVLDEAFKAPFPGAGNALLFDGVDDYVSIPTNGNIDLGHRFSVEMWVLVNDLADFPFMFDFNGQFWGHIESDGDVRQRIVTGDGNQFHENINFGFETDVWTHFAMSYDGQNTRFYKNGILTDTKATTGDVVPGDSLLEIGALLSAAQYRLDGAIDEFRVWESVIDSTHIRNWMCQRINETHENLDSLAAYYRFDHTAKGTLSDHKGGVHGTLNNINTSTNWITSGVPLGDTSISAYSGEGINFVMSNGNAISITDFEDADGLHFYQIRDTASGSTFPSGVYDADTTEYFGVHMVGGSSYDVVIDYSSNSALSSSVEEQKIRGLKRDNANDADWEVASGYFSTITSANTISIPNQTGTEYVTGFTNSFYPERAGSGYALDFDGGNDHLVKISPTNLPTVNSARSLEAWIKTTQNSAGVIAQWSSNVVIPNRRFGLQVQANGRIRVVASSNDFIGTTKVNDGNWHHIAVSFDGDTARLYIDGLLDNSAAKTYSTEDYYFHIGRRQDGNADFDGQIDEVRIWNTALDSNILRKWMCRKIDGSHDSISSLVSYYRFDESSGDTLYDLIGINQLNLTNMNPATDWVRSGAAIGDESYYTYSGTSVSDTLGNGNVITLNDFDGADGMHLYLVNDTATGSSYPTTIINQDSSQYFGAFKVGDSGSYDVTIDYSNNTSLTSSGMEKRIRALKRSGGDDNTWEVASGRLRVDAGANTVSILNQTGTEYVTGFANTSYPNRPGSGYALDFDGVDDGVASGNGGLAGMSTADSITIEAWFNTEDTTSFPFIYDSEDGTSAAFRILFTSLGQARISIREAPDSGGISIRTDSGFNDGEWHHVAFTYNGSLGPGGMNIYVDGVDVPTSFVANSSTGIANYSDSIFIGINRDLTWPLEAKLDEIRVWNSVLDQTTVRDWMCKKVTNSHPNLPDLISYHRFDDGSGTSLEDVAGGATGSFLGSPTWVLSGAALGDESKFTYGGSSLTDTLNNSNIVVIDDFDDADGLHLYHVTDTAVGSSYPSNVNTVDSVEYFGVFKVGGTTYDVAIDYSSNANINGVGNEEKARALKRSGGDDADWEVGSGFFSTDIANNIISIPNQSGTEYVTGFANSTYPDEPGSGYALSFDGTNDYIDLAKVTVLSGLTYSAWVKTTSDDSIAGYSGNAPLTIVGDHTNDVWNGFGLHGGRVRYSHYNSSWDSLIGTRYVNDGKWHHVAVTHNQSSGLISLYVDGQLDQVGNIGYGGGGGEQKVGFDRIGGGYIDGAATGDLFQGSLDEVSIWSTALSQNDIQAWMTKKLNGAHDSIDNLVAYYRLDDGSGVTAEDLVTSTTGALTNGPTWVRSGAALGDESIYTYSGGSLVDSLNNGNVVTISDFVDAAGAHLYTVQDTTEGSSFPGDINGVDSTQYFGVYLVEGSKYNVTVDYSANTGIDGQSNESLVRGLKRNGGDDVSWQVASGEFRTDVGNNTISIHHQSGTEYVTGFSTTSYPDRSGSGYALSLDGANDRIDGLNSNLDAFSPGDSMTIETWIKTTDSSGIIFLTDFDNGEPFIQLRLNGGRPQFRLRDTSGTNNVSIATVTQRIDDGEWHHLACTYNGNFNTTSMEIYIDGNLVNTGNLASGSLTQNFSAEYRFSTISSCCYFGGSLDEWRIWNATLDSNTIREWMSMKLNSNHAEFDELVSYIRFDEGESLSPADLIAGTSHDIVNSTAAQSWVRSGAALGDRSIYSYSNNNLVDTMTNGNVITIQGFDDADGVHLYVVTDTATGSTYPNSIISADSAEYFGVYRVGGSSYDVSIDYTNNTVVNGQPNEHKVRAIKRSGGDDGDWQTTTGELRTNVDDNVVQIPNQTGTEYVLGFVANDYPARPGSGYALDFDGVNDHVVTPILLDENDSLTMAVWYYNTGTPSVQKSILMHGQDTYGDGWSAAIFHMPSGVVQASIVNTSSVQPNAISTDTLVANTWNHLAMTYSPSSGLVSLYINGILEATTVAANTQRRSSTQGLLIGRGNLANEFVDGRMDEVAVWNTDLDSTTLRDWMCRKIDTNHPSIDDMVAYYRFDESVNDTLVDLVGGNDAPLINMDITTDWVLSGAYLGDTSVHDYSSLNLSLASSYGDAIEVTAQTGGAVGLHVFRVDEAPNDTVRPATIDFIDTTHYYGYFIAGGNNPTANIAFSYGGNSGLTAINNGDDVMLLGRDANNSNWSGKALAILSNDNVVDSVIISGQPHGQEIVAGVADYLTPPGSGYALDFDGTNDFVDLSNGYVAPSDLSLPTETMTVEAWVKPQSFGYYDGIVGYLQDNGAFERGFGLATETGGQILFGVATGATPDIIWHGATGLDSERYYHVAGVYDGDSSKVYIDGVQVSAQAQTGQISYSSSYFNVGRYADDNETHYFDGAVDEIRLWGAALDQEVIRKWMSRKMDNTHDSIASLISYYRFDQQDDSVLVDLFGGNNGSLENMDYTSDWVVSGAAIGDSSVYAYDGSNAVIINPDGDSIVLSNYSAGVEGVQLYYVAERSNSGDFYGVQSEDTSYYFGVHKAGDDTATYDVKVRYGNNSHLTGASQQYRVGLAKRDNNADPSWEADWFYGNTDVANEIIYLPNQTGTEYTGIVSANNALHFDGSDDFVSIPNTDNITFDTQEEFTVQAWVNIPATNQTDVGAGTNEILTMWNGGGGPIPYAFRYNNQTGTSPGTVRAVQHDGTTGSAAYSTTTINDGTWHHLTMVKFAENIVIYVDGVPEDTATDNATATTITGASLKIGGQNTNRSLLGSVDEVKIWSRALCEAEVLDLYTCQFDSANHDSLVAYYSFNQGVADSINTGLDSLIDLSGFNQHGTLNNMALTGTTSNWIGGTDGLTGTCGPYLAPEIDVASEGIQIINGDTTPSSLDSTDFGSVVLLESHQVQYQIFNTGESTLIIDSVFFTGNNNNVFFAFHPDSVQAGDSGTITMVVTPTQADSLFDTLYIATNDCGNSPYSFAVRGFVLGYAGALNFDGVNDYVNMADTLGYVGMSELTVEAWIRTEDTTSTLQAILSNTGFTFVHFQVGATGGNNVFYNEFGTVGMPIIPITPLGVWRHVAMTIKSGESRVYENGVQIGTTVTNTFDSITVNNSNRIGSGFGGARFFDGDIDEIRLWDRALDSTEIQANMNCELEGTECGLIAYYNFNSDSAKIFGSNPNNQTVEDSSGNGHTGTLNGFALSGDSSNWVGQSDSIFNNCIDNGDLVGPIVIPVDTLVVYLTSEGYAIIDSNQADSASCDYYSGIQSFTVSEDTVYCSDDGDTLTLTAIDSTGLGGSATFIINVRDSLPPIVRTRGRIIYLDTNGNAFIDSDTVDGGSFDFCDGVDLSIDVDSFGCDNVSILNAKDTIEANTSTGIFGTGPGAQTFVSDSSGFLTDIALYLLKTSIGTTTRTLEIVSGDPNSTYVLASTSFNLAQNIIGSEISIEISDPPYIIAGDTYSIRFPDLNAIFESARFSTTNTYANGERWTGSSGAMTASSTSDYYFITSLRTVNSIQSTILSVTDSSGNTQSDSAFLAVLDTISPVLNLQNVTVQLDSTGQAIVTASMFDNGSTDNCSIDSIFIDADTVTCADTGSITVTFTAFDPSNNSSSGTAQLIIVDDSLPNLVTKLDTFYLDTNGRAYTIADSINDGSHDNCAIDSVWLADTIFFCADTGLQSTMFFASDPSGNIDSVGVNVYIADSIRPTVITQTVTAYLDTNGNAVIDTGDVNNGTIDNCGIDSLWLSDTLFNCADTVGDTTWLIVRDLSGNMDSAFAEVIIEDTVRPNLQVQNISVSLDSNGEYVLTAAQFDNGTTDNCNLDTIYIDQDTLTCSDTGNVAVIFTAMDLAGNIATANVFVTVSDDTLPTLIVQNDTLYLDAGGSVATIPANVDSNSFDNCGIDTIWLADTLYQCADTGWNTTLFFAMDLSGNVDSTPVSIYVIDSIFPTVIAQDITVYLDSSGSISIDTGDINVGTFDNCGIDSLWLSDTAFACSDTIGDTIWLFASDLSGNIDSAFSVIDIQDTVSPVLQVQNIAISLDSSGQYLLTASQFDNGTSDNCAIDTLIIDQDTVFCSDTGVFNVLFTAIDVSGNSSSTNVTVTISDDSLPTILTQLDTIYIGTGGFANTSPTNTDNGTYDNCIVDSIWLSDTIYFCSDTGLNSTTFFARDESGNTDSASVSIYVIDTILPTVIPQDITVQLGTGGTVSIDTGDVNNGSFDNCSIDSLWLSDTLFNCADTIGDTIWLFARDINGNVDSATSIITIEDTVSPVVIASSINIYLDTNGSATIAADSVDFGTTDNCQVDSIWLDQYTFGCSDTNGTQITLFARDVSGNISSDTTIIYTIDTVPPVVVVQSDTIYLNTIGVATLDTSDVDGGTYDNCSIDSLWLSDTIFGCIDTTSSDVTFFARDVSGNVSTYVVTIIILDSLPPVAIAKDDTVYLDTNGMASITVANVDDSSSDNCAMDTLWLSQYDFTCADSNGNEVVLFVEDVSSNVSTDTSTVYVLDTIRPSAIVNNITIYLDSTGGALIAADTIDSGSFDNCAVDSIWLSNYSYSCTDTVSPDTILFFVKDVSGNRDSAFATVTVLDTQPPVVVPRDITVYLDTNGGISFSTIDIDSLSDDNCFIDSMWLSVDTFACIDSNANVITLIVRDISGNIDSANATVTVLDTVRPTVLTQPRTVYLNSSGALTISPDTIDNGSYDNCSIDSIWLSANSFVCADTGDTMLYLYVRDVSGNIDSANATLTIEDTLPPVIVTNNITVYIDSNGNVDILPDTVDNGSNDNCAIATTWISDSNFTCTDTSAVNTIWFYAKDVSGNVDSATADVTVLDTMPPLILASDLTIHLDTFGVVSIAHDSADTGTVDNCFLDSIWMSQVNYSCADVGANTITVFAEDFSGNRDSLNITVNVLDTIAPVAIAQGLNLALDSFGQRIITPFNIDNGSWDSCGIDSLIIDTDTFDCGDVGSSITITLTVVDVNGNSSTDTSTVTIVDTIAPEVITQDITVYLDNNGEVTITPIDIDNGTWDSCGIDTMYLSLDSFDCSDVGNNSVTLFAQDVNNNLNSQTATVTVVDSTFPAAIAFTDTIVIYLDSFGEATIGPDTIDSASFDNCSYTKSINSSFFTCVDAGFSQPIVLTITDASGNISLDTGYIFVDDTIPPVPNTFDSITVSLDSFGFASIDTSDVLIAISDSCAIASIIIDSSDFSCANTLSPVIVSTQITDTNGNTGIDSTVVTIVDDIFPQAFLNDTILYLNDTTDGNARVIIDSASLDSASYDVCGIESIVHQTYFDCSDIGTNSVTVTITDVNGNVTTQNVTVQVLDTVAPKIHLFADTSVWLSETGFKNLNIPILDSASYDNCPSATRVRIPANVNCNRVGDTADVRVTITDVAGNSRTDTVHVYTFDTVLPQPEVKNITIYLDTQGFAVVQGDTVDSASNDACGIDSIWLDTNTFNCADIGANTVQVFVRDVNMNIDSSATAVITVVDTLAPIALSIDTLTVYLNDSGYVEIVPSQIDSGSWDSCGISGYALSDTAFTCADVGAFPTTTLSVTDLYSNTGTSITIVEVIDTIRPVALPFDTNVFYLDANGQLTIGGIDLDSASYDSCGVGTYLTDTAYFDCGNIGSPITATMTVIDVNGNMDSATTIIVILDTVSPQAIAQDISVYLDSVGEVSITASMINNGSFDSCGVDTFFIDSTDFTCINTLSPVPVTLTVVDVNGNSSTDIGFVTVLDTVNPIVTTHDTTLYLDVNGEVVLDTSFINDGSSDNCLIDTMTLTQSLFTCAEAGLTLPITLTVFDGTGNSDTSTSLVTIMDTVRPEPLVQNIDVFLDANGNAVITASLIDSASYDSCGIDSIWLDVYDFDCGDVGDNTVEFFVRDVNQNMDSAFATVSVFDTVSPTAFSLPTYTVWLDNNGEASITRDSVNNGSYDSCGIASYFLNDSLFDCTDLGAFPTITLTVFDVNGNSSTAQTVVTVLDTISPIAIASDYTAYLNSSGTITIDSSNIDNSSNDNCAIATISLDTSTFDCSDIGETNVVTMTVTDFSGNSSTATALVTVLDTVAPEAIGQNITIELDSFGHASIDSSDVNNGSNDACGIDSITLSRYDFDCGDVASAQDIEMYVFDVNTNSDTTTITITVEDNIAPQAYAIDSLTIALDSQGVYTLEVLEIDSGSWDSCGIDTMTLSQSVFTCADVGTPISVVLTVTDVNGNSSDTNTIITVIDTIAPEVHAINDTVYLDTIGQISITPANVDSNSWDSCGIATYAIDTFNFSCANTDSAVQVILTLTDVNGNSSSDTSFVFVLDTLLPIIVCQSDTQVFNDSGQCGAVVSFALPITSDNCEIDTVFQSGDTTYQSGDEFPVGTTLVQFTAIDVNGNEDSCSFNVTVIDTQAPQIQCIADTLICDSVFSFSLPTVIENCPNDTIEQIEGIESGNVYPVGETTNTFVVRDASGNTDTCSFIVTRIDYPSLADAGPDSSLCDTQQITLYASSPANGIGSWTSLGTALLSDTADPSSVATQLTIGSNQFVWTVRNSVCVPTIDTVDIEMYDRPSVVELPSDTSLCEDSDFSLVGADILIGSAVWSISGDAVLSDSISDTLIITNMGIDDITIYRTNTNGACATMVDSMVVHNNPNPTVDAGEDIKRFAGKSVTLAPQVIDGASYSWSPQDLFDDATILNAVMSANQTTTLKLTVTSDSGCVSSDSLIYYVNGLDSIPTGITPNGDGINDVWNIPGLSTYPESEIFVFDQSGRQVYYSKGYDTPWDGRFNGELLPRASYYWIIDLKDGVNDPLKGIISIIR